MPITRAAALIVCTTALLTAACGPSDTATTARPASSSGGVGSAPPTTARPEAEIAREARTFLLAQYGLGPEHQFRDIPREGAGTGDWAAQIDRISYARDSRELDVFMFVNINDKESALDAAHTIGLMIRQDPPVQQNVGAVRVGDKTGQELAHQFLCPLSVSDNDCEPAVWLR